MHILTIKAESLFQALSDSSRLRIIRLLASTDQEVCLCELVDTLLEPQYNLSRHLKLLRQSGFLSAQKEGRWIYHRLVNTPIHLQQLYDFIRSLPDTDGVYQADLQRFKQRLALREGGRCRQGIQSSKLQEGHK